jgi:hypothetical protein
VAVGLSRDFVSFEALPLFEHMIVTAPGGTSSTPSRSTASDHCSPGWNLADPEFFIRKAVGWALRERAKLAPDEVRRFVETHEVSPLSRREALKHL